MTCLAVFSVYVSAYVSGADIESAKAQPAMTDWQRLLSRAACFLWSKYAPRCMCADIYCVYFMMKECATYDTVQYCCMCGKSSSRCGSVLGHGRNMLSSHLFT